MNRKQIVLLSGFILFITIISCIIWYAVKGEKTSGSITTTQPDNENLQTPKVSYSIMDDTTLVIRGEGSLEEELLYPISDNEWDKIQKVVIEPGITRLGIGCFGNHTMNYKIKEIVIADSVVSIGRGCFDALYDLETVHLSKKLERIGDYAFENTNIKHIQLPDSLKKIGKYAFYHCDELQEITIPDSVTAISEDAFSECYNLKEITLSANLTKWENPGYHCPALKKVINHSQRPWKMRRAKGNKIWKVDGRETNEIPPGKTGIAEGKRYSIQYELDGARMIGTLPDSYEYGEEYAITAYAETEEEGYYCIGWNGYDIHGKDTGYFFLFEPEATLSRTTSGDFILKPLFVKYRLENLSEGALKVTISDWGLPIRQDYFEIRYSENEDMSGAEQEYLTSGDPHIITIRNLEKGKRYYVEFHWFDEEGEDDPELESFWIGRKSIRIEK